VSSSKSSSRSSGSSNVTLTLNFGEKFGGSGNTALGSAHAHYLIYMAAHVSGQGDENTTHLSLLSRLSLTYELLNPLGEVGNIVHPC
jgi:hypothetical protein